MPTTPESGSPATPVIVTRIRAVDPGRSGTVASPRWTGADTVPASVVTATLVTSGPTPGSVTRSTVTSRSRIRCSSDRSRCCPTVPDADTQAVSGSPSTAAAGRWSGPRWATPPGSAANGSSALLDAVTFEAPSSTETACSAASYGPRSGRGSGSAADRVAE